VARVKVVRLKTKRVKMHLRTPLRARVVKQQTLKMKALVKEVNQKLPVKVTKEVRQKAEVKKVRRRKAAKVKPHQKVPLLKVVKLQRANLKPRLVKERHYLKVRAKVL